jgi:hypothetical protein
MAFKDPEARRVYLARWRQAHLEEKREADREYQKNNRETIRVRTKVWAEKNKERLRAQKKAYREKTREHRLAQQAIYRETNREELRRKQREFHEKNKERRNEKNRLSASLHPERVYANNRARKARKRNAPINDLTAEQWEEIQKVFKHCCAYCGKKAKGHLTQDHITPLSKGGSHTASNVIPSCLECNLRKHTGPPPSPVQPLLFTLAPPKKAKGS